MLGHLRLSSLPPQRRFLLSPVPPFTGGGTPSCSVTSAPVLLDPCSHRLSADPAFAAAHTLAHPGIRATKHLMSARWVWAGMAADVTRWCQDCQFCQRAKVTKQPRAAVQAIPIPTRRFSHIHIDLVVPLPRSPEGANHLFTMMDRSSRWLEAIPLTSTDTATITAAFVSGWVARFGVPDHLTLDRGPQFCSALWLELSRRWGITHHLTTAYHPQANGMVERAHRQLKGALRARTAAGDWMLHLPWVLLGLQ